MNINDYFKTLVNKFTCDVHRLRSVIFLVPILLPIALHASFVNKLSIATISCTNSFRNILGGQKKRFLGFNGAQWTKELFEQVIHDEGLYAPLVRTISQNEGITLNEALSRVKFIINAPEEVITLLLASHVGYWHNNTPFISSSYRAGVASKYAHSFLPIEYTSIDDLSTLKPLYHVVFEISSNGLRREYNPLLLEFRLSKHLERIKLIYSLYEKNGTESLKILKNNLRELRLSLNFRTPSKKDQNLADNLLELEKSVGLLSWLIDHNWLRIITANEHTGRVRPNQMHSEYLEDGFVYFKKRFLSDLVEEENPKIMALMKSFYMLRDGDREILFHIDAKDISQAFLYNSNGEVIAKKH